MTRKRVWGYFSKQQNFFIFDDEIDLFRNYCRELSLFYDGIKFNIWFRNLYEQKNFYLKIFGFGRQKFPLCPKKIRHDHLSSGFVPESETSIRVSIGRLRAKILSIYYRSRIDYYNVAWCFYPPSARWLSSPIDCINLHIKWAELPIFVYLPYLVVLHNLDGRTGFVKYESK